MIEHAFRIGHHLTPAQEAEVGRAMLAASERDKSTPKPWPSDHAPVAAQGRAAERRERVLALAATKSQEEIAQLFGVSRKTIGHDIAWLRAQGLLSTPRATETARISESERSAILAKAKKLHAQGLQWSVIAKRLGVSDATLRRWR